MIGRCAVLLLLVLSAPVIGQPSIPVTPAGKYLSEWLGAFNSADPARLLEFKNTYQREWTVEEMLDWRDRNKDRRRSTRWSRRTNRILPCSCYSNYGYVLLGALIEKVSGLSYYDYVQANVYGKAGMRSTGSLPESTAVPRRATGYMRRDKEWVSSVDTLPYRGMAAGGGYSTVGDLLKFAQALEAGKLVSKKLLAEATAKPDKEASAYGYGFQVQGEGPLRWYGHGGGAPGMNGDLRIFPQLGYVLVGLSNLDPPAASRLVEYFAVRMPATPIVSADDDGR